MSFLENLGTGIAMGVTFGAMTQMSKMMPMGGVWGGGMWGFGPSIFNYGGLWGGGCFGHHHHHHHHCHSFWC